jgi:uncharacterized protein (DUF488 family)
MSGTMTIGYEGTDPERFLRALKQSEVDMLIDVRMAPFSHKPGFSEQPLRQTLEGAGIAYLHLADLGNPKLGRDAAKAGDTETFHRIYRAQLATGAAQQALSRVIELSRSHRTCLMCFERNHDACHRGIVAESLGSAGVKVTHLIPEPHMPGRRPRAKDLTQGSLF